jgi:phospholipid/cholesterol/gamma-HCH transport system ATP-binding protein
MSNIAIRFDRVTKAFGEHRVLDDVTFEIPRSTAFCLLGRSGSGKSVTLKQIIGLLQPDAGRVLIDVRQRIGFLFQHAALFDSLTVGENVAFPLRRHRAHLSEREVRRIASEKLGKVGLADVYDRMPAALSGGMRKRAGLARAIALDPPVLLVDEPSAGLDPLTTLEIDELLLELKRSAGTTLLVVTHNIPSARVIADELALLDQGRILARGTVAELDRSEHPLVQAFMRSEGVG